MIAARNFLDAINGLALEMPHVPVPTFSLGITHFVEFMDAYRGFLEGLDGGQRRLVLCASGLVSWTDERGDALAAAFDRTLAVLNSGGDPGAEPDLGGRAEPPGSPGEYHEMFACTAIFVDAVQALLPDIAEMAWGEGAGGAGAGPRPTVSTRTAPPGPLAPGWRKRARGQSPSSPACRGTRCSAPRTSESRRAAGARGARAGNDAGRAGHPVHWKGRL